MNQGIAFARTLRALNADDFRTSKLGLGLAVILLGAWAWWMLAARVPQYETSSNVRIVQGHAIAYFPSTNQIHAGQNTSVTLDGKAIPARVEEVASDHVELVFTNPQPQSPNPARSTAEIEVSRVSPAAIALHALARQ